MFGAIDDAVGWAKDGKLNSIQTEILGYNLSGINKILNPPPLPSATVTGIGRVRNEKALKQLGQDLWGGPPKQDPGIEGLRRFPKESHKFFGRPLKGKDFSEIDRMVMEGKIPDARGRTWNLGAQEPGTAGVMAALDQKTGMSRAIARNLLLKDTRLKLKPEELFMLKEGKGEPLELMRKYYGRSMSSYDDFLDNVNLQAARPDEFAEMILKNVELIPAFAHGGLARILEV